VSEQGSQDSGEYAPGNMDISEQKAMWERFGAMVKWGIVLSAILAILGTYLTYLSHY